MKNEAELVQSYKAKGQSFNPVLLNQTPSSSRTWASSLSGNELSTHMLSLEACGLL